MAKNCRITLLSKVDLSSNPRQTKKIPNEPESFEMENQVSDFLV